MLSPLQLKKHRFTEVSVRSILEGLPGKQTLVKTETSCGHAKDNDREWKVELKVEFGPNEEFKESPYSGKVCVVGFFTVLENWPAGRRQELVSINGPSVLYGAVREMILMITSRSSHHSLTLPTMSFAPLPQEQPKPTLAYAAARKVVKRAASKKPVKA